MLNITNYQGNANQNPMRDHLTLVRMAIIKKSQIINAGEDVEERQPSHTDWFSHGGESLRRLLKKLKVELPWDPAVPLLGIYLEKMKTLI